MPLSQRRWGLPAALDAAICQALAKEPAARPATAGAFAFLLKLQLKGNDWLRQQADAIHQQHRFKLMELAVRLQWRSWLMIGLVLMTTIKLPGLRPLQMGLAFGLLWLLIAATSLWKQNAVTAAFTLFLEQKCKAAPTEVAAHNIVSAIQSHSAALAPDGTVVREPERLNRVIQLTGEALLQAGCDPNAADRNGRTPLMYAVRYNQLTAASLLLKHNANAKAKDKSGLTALDMAKQLGHKEVAKLLQATVNGQLLRASE